MHTIYGPEARVRLQRGSRRFRKKGPDRASGFQCRLLRFKLPKQNVHQMTHRPLLQQRSFSITKKSWNCDHALWCSFLQSSTKGCQVFSEVRRPSSLKKLLAVVDPTEDHRDVKVLGLAAPMHLPFSDQRTQLTHIGAVGCDRAPLHRPPLDLRQSLRTCCLQGSRNLGSNAHSDGVSHEEELQGFPLKVATCMAVAISNWFSWATILPSEVGDLRCAHHRHTTSDQAHAPNRSSHGGHLNQFQLWNLCEYLI
mmetsp:Transcript_46734/g.109396  ORF Transcript_46734/g.109396 Transcript_46734/m.109396 type:complete len:253 (-) Transcript_46734:2-760(-)